VGVVKHTHRSSGHGVEDDLHRRPVSLVVAEAEEGVRVVVPEELPVLDLVIDPGGSGVPTDVGPRTFRDTDDVTVLPTFGGPGSPPSRPVTAGVARVTSRHRFQRIEMERLRLGDVTTSDVSKAGCPGSQPGRGWHDWRRTFIAAQQHRLLNVPQHVVVGRLLLIPPLS
jgi:hypothetical protein